MKTTIVYLAASAFCVLFSYVYSLYAHGEQSAYLSLLYLFPLAGGAAVFALLGRLGTPAPRIPHYRLFYNAYNSGIAAMSVASALQGVFEIAGTSSPYTALFWAAGWLLTGIGVIGYVGCAGSRQPDGYGGNGSPEGGGEGRRMPRANP